MVTQKSCLAILSALHEIDTFRILKKREKEIYLFHWKGFKSCFWLDTQQVSALVDVTQQRENGKQQNKDVAFKESKD